MSCSCYDSRHADHAARLAALPFGAEPCQLLHAPAYRRKKGGFNKTASNLICEITHNHVINHYDAAGPFCLLTEPSQLLLEPADMQSDA